MPQIPQKNFRIFLFASLFVRGRTGYPIKGRNSENKYKNNTKPICTEIDMRVIAPFTSVTIFGYSNNIHIITK